MTPGAQGKKGSRTAKARRRDKPQEQPTSGMGASQLNQFLTLSVTLTGFEDVELWGTGMVHTYYALVPSIVGDAIFGDLLTRWRDIVVRGAGQQRYIDRLVTTEMLEDPTLGPVARNLAALWYTGTWNQLPGAWRNVHGASARDLTHVISPRAYEEALVWKAIFSHPPAAKQPGFASWAMPPKEGA
jgi:hypothetical protein